MKEQTTGIEVALALVQPHLNDAEAPEKLLAKNTATATEVLTEICKLARLYAIALADPTVSPTGCMAGDAMMYSMQLGGILDTFTTYGIPMEPPPAIKTILAQENRFYHYMRAA